MPRDAGRGASEPGCADGEPGRFVLLLGGLLSHNRTTPEDHRLRDDFAPLRAHLRAAMPEGRVVLFSYGAAAYLQAGRDPRAAWIGGSYDGEAEPRFGPRETTDRPLADHVRALAWLIGDLRARDPRARIDLIGFSLGGIVALAWAAAAGDAELTAIGRVVLIGAPVGGISTLGLLAPAPVVRHLLGCFRIGFGRGLVFRDLRAGSRAIRALHGAVGRVEIDAVENSRDYLTNGRRITGQRLLPQRLRTIPLGRGAAASGFLPPERRVTLDLGGWEHHLRTTHHRILRGHSPALERLRERIAVLVATGTRPPALESARRLSVIEPIAPNRSNPARFAPRTRQEVAS